jgi:cysteinyl-tRNA synthetase
MRVFNTLTGEKQELVPIAKGQVGIYVCGITVYDLPHIGHARMLCAFDIAVRFLRWSGLAVHYVRNWTDVDDKIIKRAHEQKKTIREVTEPVTEIFQSDREFLRIERAELYPKATDYIPQMIALVKTLVDKGVAYQADDKSVYFAIDRFPQYGRLSRLDKRELKTGARVAQDDYSKENAQDFALWKAATPNDEVTGAAWDSPWGRGRPGWHLECSAMAIDLLGETLDIHCGGIDLVFPHHEDEIAQSEAATGKTFSRFWCHGAFLLIEGTKMAKRLGNVTTVQGMREAKISAAAVRHFVFNTHYRKELNLSEDALEASINAVRRVGDFAERLASVAGGTEALADAANRAVAEVEAALFDDLNAPEALAGMFTFINRANAELDKRGSDVSALEQARAAFSRINGVLDIVPDRIGGDPELAGWVEEQLAARKAARERRDFAEADRIRSELTERGVVIEDTASGTKWKLVR